MTPALPGAIGQLPTLTAAERHQAQTGMSPEFLDALADDPQYTWGGLGTEKKSVAGVKGLFDRLN